MIFGYLMINKPTGPTSHDIIDELRRLTGERRIGHAGTLDPFATGVLLVGVGREATRNLGKFVGLDKRYRAVLRLGAVSDTFDRTGHIIINSKLKHASSAVRRRGGTQNSTCLIGSPPKRRKPQLKTQNLEIDKVMRSFIGKQKQMPPQYSAKKVRGQKAYELARKGQRVKLKEQNIEICHIKITNYELLITNHLEIEIYCSSGTYIRSLAHDIGQKLGCGAYLEELERLSIGNFELSQAVKLSKLTKDNWQKYLINFNVVMAAGTFEILHPGHQYFLKEAKKLGQKLVAVIARDKLAELLRGRKLRFDENERLERVKKLDFVDQAILGDARDLYQSIKKIKPDIIALGYDQKIEMSELALKIKKFGLKTKIARIGAYCPEKYKSSLMVGLFF